MQPRHVFSSVVLSTLLGVQLTASAPARASGILASSYAASAIFQDFTGTFTSMTVAYDGAHYWSTNGGSASGLNEAEYDAAGNLQTTFTPGLDFRSLFTDAVGNVFARQFDDPTIYQQIAPGSFTPHVTLSGGSLDPQASVVLNGSGTEYDAMSVGTVDRWNSTGSFLGAVNLSGYGTVGQESSYPENRGIATDGNYWLTYDGAGTLSAWDFGGNRVGETTLAGAGTSFDSDFSLSYANTQVFIVDQNGGNWRGYNLGLPSPVSQDPEPSSLALLAAGLPMLGFLRRRKQAWASRIS